MVGAKNNEQYKVNVSIHCDDKHGNHSIVHAPKNFVVSVVFRVSSPVYVGDDLAVHVKNVRVFGRWPVYDKQVALKVGSI